MTLPAGFRLGTSAFTAAGWEGSFYPDGMKPADYLSYYATHFDTVEVDSTFYRTPSPSIVRGWYDKTPKGFLFAAKVAQTIKHEKVLLDCDSELKNFLATMDCLGEKLGPLLFQFGYFNKKAFKSVGEFLSRLRPFLKKLPKGYRFAVEIRNKNWLDGRFADTLREHKVALALIDQSWMPRIGEVLEKIDPITADFTYVRWLGDRKGIEEQTKTWDKTIVDRRRDLAEWVEAFRKFVARNIRVFPTRIIITPGTHPQPFGSFRNYGISGSMIMSPLPHSPVSSRGAEHGRRADHGAGEVCREQASGDVGGKEARHPDCCKASGRTQADALARAGRSQHGEGLLD